MKSTIYIFLSLAVSVFVGILHGSQPKTPEPIKINFKTAYNVSIGTANVSAAFPREGVDFTLNYASGRLTIGSDTGLRIEDAEVFQLDSVTWTAVINNSADYVTVNAATGRVDMYMDGQYRSIEKESSKP